MEVECSFVRDVLQARRPLAAPDSCCLVSLPAGGAAGAALRLAHLFICNQPPNPSAVRYRRATTRTRCGCACCPAAPRPIPSRTMTELLRCSSAAAPPAAPPAAPAPPLLPLVPPPVGPRTPPAPAASLLYTPAAAAAPTPSSAPRNALPPAVPARLLTGAHAAFCGVAHLLSVGWYCKTDLPELHTHSDQIASLARRPHSIRTIRSDKARPCRCRWAANGLQPRAPAPGQPVKGAPRGAVRGACGTFMRPSSGRTASWNLRVERGRGLWRGRGSWEGRGRPSTPRPMPIPENTGHAPRGLRQPVL